MVGRKEEWVLRWSAVVMVAEKGRHGGSDEELGKVLRALSDEAMLEVTFEGRYEKCRKYW